jgi:hypothetical protein
MIDATGADDRAYRPDRPDRPGSAGEHHLQQQLGTTERADRFYDQQLCDRLLPAMAEFVRRPTLAHCDERGLRAGSGALAGSAPRPATGLSVNNLLAVAAG